MRSQAIERVHRALEDIAAGKMVVVVDDEQRENEGDLVMAADLVTPEGVNFMARFGRGLICLALEPKKVDELGLPMMVEENQTKSGTAFTVSIEAREGVTTGISAADRCRTIQVAVRRGARADDLVSPGHIFPLRAVAGGVLRRAGHTEASVDMARMAGCSPAGVICEIMNDDGSMARMTDLERFAETHDLRILSIADLIQYRLQTERLVRRVAETELVLPPGNLRWKAHVYETPGLTGHHEVLALTLGQIDEAPTLVRVQMGSLLGDVFGAEHPTRVAARDGVRRIEQEGRGVVLYLPPRGDLLQDLAHYLGGGVRDAASSTPSEVVLREIGLGSQVLRDLGLRKLRILTSRPSRVVAVDGFELEIVEQVLLHQPAEPEAAAERTTH
ncbi:MAG TPA: 3,4-dihydroxy-2-butanone-4-phosphate synthase [Polyangiales bacterium]|nr:3,4-dihydroxy-2-butanone-4-phosphate synthase [Polyangiales bacterium]